jgi:hypothetical protein
LPEGTGNDGEKDENNDSLRILRDPDEFSGNSTNTKWFFLKKIFDRKSF